MFINRIIAVFKKKFNILITNLVCNSRLIALFGMLLTIQVNAQCAMCRASLESSGNKTKAESLNDGIVYLMAIPYVVVAVLGVVIYRMYAKKGK
jgi:hypothetical protein